MMLQAVLLVALAGQPLKIGVSLKFAPDTVILLEMPVPEAGCRYRRITVEQLRKHQKMVVYLEYRLVKLKLDGLTIKQAVFHLPDLLKKPASEEVVRRE